ncbi:unnamed protein product [Oikopleura dioica]|uniref:RNA helicase n=1 Tax=Oikopleura dioica TaxID=34765 RepID=E4Z3E5_OIKDI|nr:unnamed protein product [Oikopleura dioica]
MDYDSIFKKLTRGARFDRTKYREDAENLGIIPKKAPKLEENIPENDPKKGIFVTNMNIDDDTKYPLLSDFNGVNKAIRNNLKEVLRWENPTRIQMAAIPILRAGENCVCTAATGSGKTGAFMIPVIEKLLKVGKKNVKDTIFTIVLSPSRELAEQIGGVGRALARGLWPKISDTSQSDKNIQSCHVLCGTPNRIINMLDSKELDLSKCQMIVLDECDKMLEITNKLNPDDPKSFSAQVNLLRSQCADNHQMGLFSATMSGSVEKFGHANFNNQGVTVAIGKSGNAVNQNVSQKVIYCGNERGKLLALREFIKDGFRPPAILFTETKERCQRIMGELLYDGINAMSLCAAKSNADRQKVIQATRVGKVWLLITTDVASRGLDLPMTSTVINYDCPNSVTDYVHRVGRRGFK